MPVDASRKLIAGVLGRCTLTKGESAAREPGQDWTDLKMCWPWLQACTRKPKTAAKEAYRLLIKCLMTYEVRAPFLSFPCFIHSLCLPIRSDLAGQERMAGNPGRAIAGCRMHACSPSAPHSVETQEP